MNTSPLLRWLRKWASCILLLPGAGPALAQVPDFSNYPVYEGTDLGLTYNSRQSVFRIWSPVAEAAELLLYKHDSEGLPFRTVPMIRDEQGTWVANMPGNWAGTYYCFRVRIGQQWRQPVPDPYAKAVGTNGRRAQVVDLRRTDPEGWAQDASPAFGQNKATDAILYELHIRDASIDAASGIKHKGKYLGLAEWGTRSPEGLSTGLQHIAELGVTHVHLLPFFDYNSVDEAVPAKAQYNWGYDPLNYNVPEGSYSSNPADGAVRIKELKQMVQAFHQHGLRVVMDVVYNHVADAGSSNFEQLVPGYYFRQRADGSLSDATACGNETASERPMFRKFMIESLLHWVQEYHIDGFRFDLMGVHDIETMRQIAQRLRQVKPDIVLYGEGWTAGASPLPDSLRALKKNAHLLDGIAVFSDDLRDGLKGSVFEEKDRGFVSGKAGMEPSIQFGIVAGGQHPQLAYDKVNYSKAPYTSAPGQAVAYAECHDNHTLADKLKLSVPGATPEQLMRMQQLAQGLVLTSQGIPFLHAGTELLRSKKGVENSYKSPDSINRIHWSSKAASMGTVQWVQQLIALRKAHPAFRIADAGVLAKALQFDVMAPPGTVAYIVNGAMVGDSWRLLMVIANSGSQEIKYNLPPGDWQKALSMQASSGPGKGAATVAAHDLLVLYLQ